MLISCGCLRSMKAVMRRKILFGPGEKLFCDVSFEQGKKRCCIFGVFFIIMWLCLPLCRTIIQFAMRRLKALIKAFFKLLKSVADGDVRSSLS